jgi:hypothetical protein
MAAIVRRNANDSPLIRHPIQWENEWAVECEEDRRPKQGEKRSVDKES